MTAEPVASVSSLSTAKPPRRDRSDKVAEKVARRILRDIVARNLQAGAMLPPEALMLQRYDVGRASLREGLRILEVYGLIWIKPGPGGGPVVADVSSLDFGRSATFFYHAVSATLHDLVECRVHVEPVMARLASDHLTDETAASLRAVLQGEEAAIGDPRGLRQVRSDGFHDVVAGMSGNRVLGLFGQSIVDIYVERVRPVFTVDQRQSLHHTHHDIGMAILKRQAAKAERLMRAHVEDLHAHFSRIVPRAAEEIIDWR